jgi:hypothetical protein
MPLIAQQLWCGAGATPSDRAGHRTAVHQQLSVFMLTVRVLADRIGAGGQRSTPLSPTGTKHTTGLAPSETHAPPRAPSGQTCRETAQPDNGGTAMAGSSGDRIVLETARGRVEAQRMGRTESGSSRWQVAFPWGVETFSGTSSELLSHAHQRIADEAAKAHGPGGARRH